MEKRILMTLSRVFPMTHSRSRQPTNYRDSLLAGEKIHTIRANYVRWQHNISKIENGDFILSIREWSGKPYNSPMRNIVEMKEHVGIQHITMTYGIDDKFPEVWVDDKRIPIQEVVKNDGLRVEDFIEWFFGKNKGNVFDGAVIHFTDFRY